MRSGGEILYLYDDLIINKINNKIYIFILILIL